LRRILMWDGYPFFPLRKDFPLEGLPSEMPDVAFTKITPMEGGPFVTVPSTATSKDREPRAHPPELRRGKRTIHSVNGGGNMVHLKFLPIRCHQWRTWIPLN